MDENQSLLMPFLNKEFRFVSTLDKARLVQRFQHVGDFIFQFL